MKLVVAPEAAAQIFEILSEEGEVWVIAIRGANQRRGPRLAPR